MQRKSPKSETEVESAEPVAAPPCGEPVVPPCGTAPTEAPPCGESGSRDNVVKETSSFVFYVKQLTASIKEQEKYSKIRMGGTLVKHLADLQTEMLQRITYLTRLTVEAMQVKTVNDITLLKTVEKILVDGHKPVESLEFTTKKGSEKQIAQLIVSYPTAGYNELAAVIKHRVQLLKEWNDAKGNAAVSE